MNTDPRVESAARAIGDERFLDGFSSVLPYYKDECRRTASLALAAADAVDPYRLPFPGNALVMSDPRVQNLAATLRDLTDATQRLVEDIDMAWSLAGNQATDDSGNPLGIAKAAVKAARAALGR